MCDEQNPNQTPDDYRDAFAEYISDEDLDREQEVIDAKYC